jgi:hypothetical protein
MAPTGVTLVSPLTREATTARAKDSSTAMIAAHQVMLKNQVWRMTARMRATPIEKKNHLRGTSPVSVLVSGPDSPPPLKARMMAGAEYAKETRLAITMRVTPGQRSHSPMGRRASGVVPSLTRRGPMMPQDRIAPSSSDQHARKPTRPPTATMTSVGSSANE